ncbi:MAG: type II toxin-antitoxin system HicB family antitoxin [Chthoniobacterales bacterium]
MTGRPGLARSYVTAGAGRFAVCLRGLRQTCEVKIRPQSRRPVRICCLTPNSLPPETHRWAAFFPELPGCASAGDSEKEAVRNAKEALALWFEPSRVDFAAGAKVVQVRSCVSEPWL